MGRLPKLKKPTVEDQGTIQPTTQTASNPWRDGKSEPPPYNLIITVQTKSGTVINDCARIANGKVDVYVDDYGKDVLNVIQWRNYNWVYPGMKVK